MSRNVLLCYTLGNIYLIETVLTSTSPTLLIYHPTSTQLHLLTKSIRVGGLLIYFTTVINLQRMLSLRVYTVYITKCKKPARYLSEPTFFSGTWTHGSSGSTAPYGFYYFVSSADSVHHCDFKQFSVAFILMLLFI